MKIIKTFINQVDSLKNRPVLGAAGVLGTLIGLASSGIDFTSKLSGPAKAQVVDTAAIEEVASNAAEKAAWLTLKDSRNSMIPLHQATVSEPSIISGKKPRDVFPYITKLEDLTSYRFTFGDFVSQTTVNFFKKNNFNGWDNLTAPRDPLKSITATETSNTLGQRALAQLIGHLNGERFSLRLRDTNSDISPDTPVVIVKGSNISQVSSDAQKMPNPLSKTETPYGPQIIIDINKLKRWIESQDENGLPIVPKQLTDDPDFVNNTSKF